MAAAKKKAVKPRSGKTASKKSSTTKAGGRSKTVKKSTVQKSTAGREVVCIACAAVGILIMLSTYFENGAGFIGKPIKTFFLGMFGFGAYVIPLVIISISLFALIYKDYEYKLPKILEGIAIFVNMITFVHMLSFDDSAKYESFTGYISVFFENGAISNGGLVGAVFGNLFLRTFGRFAAFLIVIIIFISLGVVLTDKSFFNFTIKYLTDIKEKISESFSKMSEDEYYEDEDEDVPQEPVRVKKTRQQDRTGFEMPPVAPKRNKPSNIVIENRRKAVSEEKILIFNKAEKTSKKPILMPPTRKGIVNVITLNQNAENKKDKYIPTPVHPGTDKEEVFIETPIIKHYERRSFTESVPFSNGNYSRTEMEKADDFMPDETESMPEYDDFEDFRLDGTETFDDIVINGDIEEDYELPYSTDEEARSGELDYEYEDAQLDSDYEDAQPDSDYEDAQPDDDYEDVINEEYEQRLQEQELNALLMARTGPFKVIETKDVTKASGMDERSRTPVSKSEIVNKPSLPPPVTRERTTAGPVVNMSEKKHYNYVFPSIELLNKVPVSNSSLSRARILETSKKLEETLKSFGVEARVVEVSKGPTVTRYELSPGAGVKVSKISGLADDLALNLAADGIRIEAPIPGKAAVGIEVPNKEVTPVFLREVIDDELFTNFPSMLAFALGKDITGNTVVTDIAKMPHLLIAGATGSGKSVCINTLITSLIYKANPDDVKLLMVDPKVVELSIYNGIPHLLIPVVTDPKKAAGALNWAVQEMIHRYNAFAETSVRDLKGYNAMIKERGEGETLPQIVIIIDELADLMMAAPGEVEDAICRLAQMARAAGLHLIIATQRPSVDVITGVIKANIPSRLAFSVSSGTDSRTILDMVGAEKLLGRGDMLFCPMGASKPIRVQGAFISDKEVESIVNFLKQDYEQGYDADVIAKITASKVMSEGTGGGDVDEFFDEAIEFIIQKEKASASMLQRQFRIGYNRASRLIEEFEARGIVGAEDGSKPRKVLMTSMQWEDYKNNR